MINNLDALSQSTAESLEAQKKIVREIFVSTKKEVQIENALDSVLEDEL